MTYLIQFLLFIPLYTKINECKTVENNKKKYIYAATLFISAQHWPDKLFQEVISITFRRSNRRCTQFHGS